MIIMVEIIWFIASLKDFIKTAKHIKIKYILHSVKEYTFWFIFVHILALFLYSLFVFLQGME
jgi:hypothetical protein